MTVLLDSGFLLASLNSSEAEHEATIDCNLHKGTNLTGFDPETNVITELFHPRRHSWEDHFHWQGLYLVGKTATGRTTIRVLSINSEDQVALRSS